MKWLIIIIVVLAVAGIAFAAQRIRSGPPAPPLRPHRLDDAVSPPITHPRPESSGTHISDLAPPAEPGPGSDFAQEPGITDPDVPEDPTTGGRPQA